MECRSLYSWLSRVKKTEAGNQGLYIMKTTPNLKEIALILKARLPSRDYHAVLFGSRVRGDDNAGSDWDIGIIGPAPLRGAVMELIREDFENLRTLHAFDVVDMTTVSDSFRKIALKYKKEIV